MGVCVDVQTVLHYKSSFVSTFCPRSILSSPQPAGAQWESAYLTCVRFSVQSPVQHSRSHMHSACMHMYTAHTCKIW